MFECSPAYEVCNPQSCHLGNLLVERLSSGTTTSSTGPWQCAQSGEKENLAKTHLRSDAMVNEVILEFFSLGLTRLSVHQHWVIMGVSLRTVTCAIN